MPTTERPVQSRAAARKARLPLSVTFHHDGKWIVAFCPEIPEANGQGRTEAEAEKSLWEAIQLLAEDRRSDAEEAEAGAVKPLMVA